MVFRAKKEKDSELLRLSNHGGNMKKLLVPLALVLLVFSSALVLAEEESSEDVDSEGTGFFPHLLGPIKKLQMFMQEHGLTEENTIGELLSAMKTEKENRLEAEMAEYGVDSVEELQDAKKAEHIEALRERLGLDEDASDEEVLAAAKEARLDRMREFLGLSEDASEEEIKEAMKAWSEEHGGIKPFFGRGPHFGGGR